jgi:hypothetical protein
MIRDGARDIGYSVLTFANVLKYPPFPLAEILADIGIMTGATGALFTQRRI